jgi:hypothetical protein
MFSPLKTQRNLVSSKQPSYSDAPLELSYLADFLPLSVLDAVFQVCMTFSGTKGNFCYIFVKFKKKEGQIYDLPVFSIYVFTNIFIEKVTAQVELSQ